MWRPLVLASLVIIANLAWAFPATKLRNYDDRLVPGYAVSVDNHDKVIPANAGGDDNYDKVTSINTVNGNNHNPHLSYKRQRMTSLTVDNNSDNRFADNGFQPSESMEHGSTDNESTDNQQIDDGFTHNESDDNESVDNKSVEKESVDNESVDNESVDNESVDNQSIDNDSVDNKSASNMSVDSKSVEIEADNDESEDNESEDNESVENDLVINKPAHNKSVDNEADRNESENNYSVNNESVDNESMNNESQDYGSVNNESVGNGLVDNESVDNESVDNKSADNKSVDSESLDNVPVDNESLDIDSKNSESEDNKVDMESVDDESVNDESVDMESDDKNFVVPDEEKRLFAKDYFPHGLQTKPIHNRPRRSLRRLAPLYGLMKNKVTKGNAGHNVYKSLIQIDTDLMPLYGLLKNNYEKVITRYDVYNSTTRINPDQIPCRLELKQRLLKQIQKCNNLRKTIVAEISAGISSQSGFRVLAQCKRSLLNIQTACRMSGKYNHETDIQLKPATLDDSAAVSNYQKFTIPFNPDDLFKQLLTQLKHQYHGWQVVIYNKARQIERLKNLFRYKLQRKAAEHRLKRRLYLHKVMSLAKRRVKNIKLQATEKIRYLEDRIRRERLSNMNSQTKVALEYTQKIIELLNSTVSVKQPSIWERFACRVKTIVRWIGDGLYNLFTLHANDPVKKKVIPRKIVEKDRIGKSLDNLKQKDSLSAAVNREISVGKEKVQFIENKIQSLLKENEKENEERKKKETLKIKMSVKPAEISAQLKWKFGHFLNLINFNNGKHQGFVDQMQIIKPYQELKKLARRSPIPRNKMNTNVDRLSVSIFRRNSKNDFKGNNVVSPHPRPPGSAIGQHQEQKENVFTREYFRNADAFYRNSIIDRPLQTQRRFSRDFEMRDKTRDINTQYYKPNVNDNNSEIKKNLILRLIFRAENGPLYGRSRVYGYPQLYKRPQLYKQPPVYGKPYVYRQPPEYDKHESLLQREKHKDGSGMPTSSDWKMLENIETLTRRFLTADENLRDILKGNKQQESGGNLHDFSRGSQKEVDGKQQPKANGSLRDIVIVNYKQDDRNRDTNTAGVRDDYYPVTDAEYLAGNGHGRVVQTQGGVGGPQGNKPIGVTEGRKHKGIHRAENRRDIIDKQDPRTRNRRSVGERLVNKGIGVSAVNFNVDENKNQKDAPNEPGNLRDKRYVHADPDDVIDYDNYVQMNSIRDAPYYHKGYPPSILDVDPDHIGPMYAPVLDPQGVVDLSIIHPEPRIYRPGLRHPLMDIDQELADTGVALNHPGGMDSLLKILTFEKERISKSLDKLKQKEGLSAAVKREISAGKKKVKSIENRIQKILEEKEKENEERKKKAVEEMHDLMERRTRNRLHQLNSKMKGLDETISQKNELKKLNRNLQLKIAENMRLEELKREDDEKKAYDKAVQAMKDERQRIVKEKIANLESRAKEFDKAIKAHGKMINNPSKASMKQKLLTDFKAAKDMTDFDDYLDVDDPGYKIVHDLVHERNLQDSVVDKYMDDD